MKHYSTQICFKVHSNVRLFAYYKVLSKIRKKFGFFVFFFFLSCGVFCLFVLLGGVFCGFFVILVVCVCLFVLLATITNKLHSIHLAQAAGHLLP